MKTNLSMLAAAVALTLSMGTTTANAEGQDMTPRAEGFGCTYNFTSANHKWCVNSGGNLQKLESPAGAEHIAVGNFLEGFVLCINNVATYYDTGEGNNSGNMSAGALFAGPTSSGVTVRRTTNDGNFMIEHKWSRDTTERDLTLQLAIQNTSAAAIPSVKVLRIVDVDANGDPGNSGYDKSRLGTWIRKIDAVGVAGLTLNLAPITAITTFTTAVTCTPASVAVPAVGDAMAWVGYDFGSISAGAKKTVKFGYQVQ